MNSGIMFMAGVAGCLSVCVIIGAISMLINLWVRKPVKTKDKAIEHYFVVYMVKQREGGFTKHCQVEVQGGGLNIDTDYDEIIVLEKRISSELEDENAVTVVNVKKLSVVWADTALGKAVRIRA